MEFAGEVLYDLYFCPKRDSDGGFVIARRSSSGSDYLSLDSKLLDNFFKDLPGHPLKVAAARWQYRQECDPTTRSADRRDFTRDLQVPPEVRAHEGNMTQGTRNWLSYTDGLLKNEDETAKEIKLIMSVQRGPDYVRLNGGEISPRQEDRLPVKKVTTAVLRARFFPQAAAAANKAGQFVRETVAKFGVDEKKAAAVADLLGIKSSNWTVAPPPAELASSRVLDDQLGAKSHFTLKVKAAAALLGIYR
jgi:hypothetical protein